MAKPASTGVLNRKIIVVPCIVNSSLYVPAPRIDASGVVSCTRMIRAWIPAMKKNTNAV